MNGKIMVNQRAIPAFIIFLLMPGAGALFAQSAEEKKCMGCSDLIVLTEDADVEVKIKLTEEQWKQRLTPPSVPGAAPGRYRTGLRRSI